MSRLHPPERDEIESLLARGAGVSAVASLMRETFSRRAVYRHREKHMVAAVALPAARPVAYPHSANPVKHLNGSNEKLSIRRP